MPNVTTTQLLKDHTKGWAVKLTNESDGTAEGAVTKVDASALVTANGGSTERLTITKILWNVSPGASPTAEPRITLHWAGDAPNTIVTLSGSGSWDLTTNAQAPLTNAIANTNGDILLSTANFTTGAAYTVILEGRKVLGYTSREVTDDGIA
jgi:hypothetical protein